MRHQSRRHPPGGQFANSQDANHAEESSANRAELARAMGKPKEVAELNAVRAEESRIRDEVGIRSDGRVYGSGSTNDPRGHRHLLEHFEKYGDLNKKYAGPEGYNPVKDPLGSEHDYQQSTKPKIDYSYTPTHPKAARDDGKPGGWFKFKGGKRTGWAD